MRKIKRKRLYLFVAFTLIVSLLGVVFPAVAATITPDGNPGDWAGIPPVVNEPGDSSPATSPDIVAALLTHDATKLYVRMDIAQMAGGTALHAGIDADRNIATGYNTDTDPSNVFLQAHKIGIDYEIRIVVPPPGGPPPNAYLYSVAGPAWNPTQIVSLTFGLTPPGGAPPFVAEVAMPLNLVTSPFPWKFVFWVNPAAGGLPSDEAPNGTFSIYPPPRIPFVSDRDGNLEIYSMNQDGSNQTRLTNNLAYDNMPAPSPVGGRIAFVSGRDGNREIYVMNADGANQTRLTSDNAQDIWPAWSPDGARIAFTSNRDGNFEIYVMNADSTNQTRLTYNPAADIFPAWSPGSTRIAFVSGRDGDYGEIYVMNADGANQTRLTYNPAPDNFPYWSPDSTRIAFSTNRDNNFEVYVMSANGTNPINLSNNLAADWQPQWGPDGTRIAFSTNRDNNSEVYVMDASGANQTNLTNNSTGDWSRGKWVTPTVTTANATGITANSAVLSGNLTALGSILSVLVSFDWGISSGNYTGATTPVSTNATGAFSANLSGLSANTTYHFRAKAIGDGVNYGVERSFTTSAPSLVAPTVTTDNATNITSASTQLNGTLTGLGSAATANVSFQWGTSSGNYTFETALVSMNATGAFSANLTGLSANTTYYFRARAIGDGTGYGAEKSFTTLAPSLVPPTVTTDNATNITTTGARLNGSLTSVGTASSANVSFQWGTASGNYTFETALVSMNATSTFSANLSGLSANTTYYFRAKAVGDGVGYGSDMAFTTAPTPSELSPAEDIALNPSGTGYPHPLESDAGWGGGAKPWDIVDGRRTYPGEWARGLAFTGGSLPYIEPAGWRQATINFGVPKTFNRVVVWHHGLDHVPNTYKIQYWDGTGWVDIFSTTNGHAYLKYPAAPPTNWWEGWSTPTENSFNLVTSTKVRFALWNGDITHGWIYEFEVYYKALPGDANGDGNINSVDITQVERIIANLDNPTPGADANQDGKINALDITKVERLIAGLN